MLFEFGRFWKACAVIGACWLVYLVFGYEFSMITILAALLSVSIVKENDIIY